MRHGLPAGLTGAHRPPNRPRRMWRKLQITSFLLAWLFATGSQWDLVQVFAWGRMFADNATTMSLAEAARETFAPDHICPLCQAVSRAKQQQDNPSTPAAKVPGKILLVFQPVPAVIIAAPPLSPWSPSDRVMLSTGRLAPPTPPPRAA